MSSGPADRLEGALIAAVPVPFRREALAVAAQEQYAAWMARHPLAGVAVWAHTGRGPHLTAEQRRRVLEVWRDVLPGRTVIAGVHDITTAIEARRGHADALLVFPTARDAVAHHARLGRELPAIAFWLYDAAGGVAWDDATLHAILDLPQVIGIKVATLDSVATFTRIAGILHSHPDKLLITGEDRFLGRSLELGARAALVGMAAALPDVHAALVGAHRARERARAQALGAILDRFAAVAFADPVDGYVRRMLWAAAAEGALPDEACDDPWGPALPSAEADRVRTAVADARAAFARL